MVARIARIQLRGSLSPGKKNPAVRRTATQSAALAAKNAAYASPRLTMTSMSRRRYRTIAEAKVSGTSPSGTAVSCKASGGSMPNAQGNP